MVKSDNSEALNRLFSRLGREFGESGHLVIKIIIDEIGGMRVTVPDWEMLNREERDKKIKNLFRGNNYEELALRFGISERHVRRILG